MEVNIEINCDNTGELLSHLADITRTITTRSCGDMEHDFEVGTHFLNNNCYGTHEVTIEN